MNSLHKDLSTTLESHFQQDALGDTMTMHMGVKSVGNASFMPFTTTGYCVSIEAQVLAITRARVMVHG